MEKTMYKVVYDDKAAGRFDDWSGEVESYEEAVELLKRCINQGEVCFIAEKVYYGEGVYVWEEC